MAAGIEHICRCRKCDAGSFPSGPRASPEHYAVRLGDTTARPLLDGRSLDLATEVFAGGEGRAYVYGGPGLAHERATRCACGHGVCETEIHGRLEIIPRS